MDPLKQLNMAMQRLEERLPEEPDLECLARIAGCSSYHFRRMFSFLAGMPVGEYVRRRRLTMAAELLRREGVKVIDVALALGYDSPDAFARAFAAQHGITPSQARRDGVTLRAFPPMSFQLSIQGGEPMEYRIVEKEAFRVAGVKKRITLIYSGVNHQMDSMWEELAEKGIPELKALCNCEPAGILCVSANFTAERAEGDELDQYIGVATTWEAPQKWEVLEVPASTWAVFTARGPFPDTLQTLWGRIYAEWFPTAGYQLTGGPEILWNESPDTSKPDYHSEIWIPVCKG